MKKNIQSSAILNNGLQIPYLGLGTWQAKGTSCEQAIEFALTHGYSLIDTAQAYGNELEVGKGWKKSGKPRNEIFITTKIRNANQGYDKSQESFEKSLINLQTDYVDLLLIHWPEIGNFDVTIETWQAMNDLYEKDLCRSIGVSNFTIPLTEKLINETNVVPAVNQVEFHPFLYQNELLEYCNQNNIQLEAYSPLAKAKFLNNDLLQNIARKYDKTAAQVMLAWGINHDIVVIPKSGHKDRIKENSDIFFELEEEDMKAMNALGPETRLVNGPWAPPSW